MSFWQRTLDTLIDPNIIALMLSLGVVGILVELWNPGLVLPGTVGAISLLVGLYGLQVLPVSAAGVLMLLLSLGLFVDRRPRHLARRADARRRGHVRDRRADALRPCRARVPGLALDRARDRGNARAPARRRALADRQGAAQSRSRSGVGLLVGEEAEVRRDGLVAVNGELWRARRVRRPAAAARRARHRRGSRRRPRPGRRIREPHRRDLAPWTSH